MSQKRDAFIYILAFLIAGLSMLGIMFIITQMGGNNLTTVPPASSTTSIPNQQDTIKISFGDKNLIPQESSDKNLIFQAAKQKGIEAMAGSRYAEAITEFEKARNSYQNSPETLIYLNNARIGSRTSHTIAIVAPISAEADSSLKLLRGIAQAQDEINKSGEINGTPLRIIIADDEGKPEIAKQVASQLAKKDDVLAVVGHHSSGSTLAAKEIYDSQKLVAISSVSTSVELSANPDNTKRYVFRTVPSDAFAAKALASYMLTTLNKQKAVVFYDPKSAYSKSLKNEFVQEVVQNEGQVVDEISLSNDNFNASDSVNQAINRGAQVLMLAAPYDRINNAISIINVNKKRLNLLGGDDIYNIKILQEAETRAEGMVFGIAWSIDSNPNSEFVRKSRSIWNADVDWKTAMTYDATQALITALKKNPTRNGVQEALSSAEFQTPGVSDTIRFIPSSGDRIAKVQLVQIKKISDGKKSRSGTGFDFVFLPK
ncbi:MAG: ABC transporter substrate-binding protein [Scytonematopsis contorta HA4267-MV1]|jgi:branched-chain amino acid transport system substrate-binding protein|nr:ABC transporter substrate-binding protein [Scytonematopsis contorta HA4267-MV1]